MRVITRSGNEEPMMFDKIVERLNKFSVDLSDIVDTTIITQKVIQRIYDKIKTSELDELTIEYCLQNSINHPDFSKLNLNKVRSGNVIGGGERAKNRLFTDLIQSFNNNLPIEIRNPKHIRPWQYILDSLYGYLLIAKNSYENNTSEVFNLNSEINNHYEVKQITELFKNFSEHDKEIVFNNVSSYKEVDILKINSSKAENELKWKAKVEIPKIIELIIKWEEHHKKIQNPNYSFNEIESYLNI